MSGSEPTSAGTLSDPAIAGAGGALEPRVLEPGEGRDQAGAAEGAGPGPTLLASCADRLPINQIVTDVHFTRFVKPKMLAPRIDTRDSRRHPEYLRAVLPRTLSDPRAAAMAVAARRDATWLEAQGGVAPIREWNMPHLDAPVAATVDVADLGPVLANRSVTVEGTTLSLDLDADAVRNLVAGVPQIVPVASAKPLGPGQRGAIRGWRRRSQPDAASARTDPAFVVLTPPAAAGPNIIVLDDLAAFLVNPVLSSEGPPVPLSEDQVSALVKDGRVTVEVAGRPVDLVTAPHDLVRDAEVETTPTAVVFSPSGEPILELVLALQWRQRWKLAGYSRGALLSSVSLAPQEQTTVEIFTWDRRRRESERTSSVEVNNNFDSSDTTRDTTDVFNETKRSSNLTWNLQGGLTLPITTGVTLTAGGSVQNQQTMEGISRSTSNHVHDVIFKSATTVKVARQTKVSESVEYGSEQRVSRTLANPNMCRVLNLDFYEVLSHYQVSTSFDRDATQLCVLVPNPVTPSFTRLTVRANESALRRALLERSLDDAFDAVRLLAARDNACEVLCERCTCAGGTTSGGQEPAALSAEAAAALSDIARSWNAIIMQASMYKSEGGSVYKPVDLSRNRRWIYMIAVEALAPAVLDIAYDLRAQVVLNSQAPTRMLADRLWWAITGIGGVDAIRPSKLAAERQQLLDDLAYDISSRLPNGSGYVGYFTVYLRSLADDAGFTSALDRFMASFSAKPAAQASLAGMTPAQPDPLQVAAIDESIRQAFPLPEITAALEREEALLEHLSANASYYWLALWQARSATQQASLLEKALPANIPVDPWPIGIVGNQLAFPVGTTIPTVAAFLKELFDPEAEPLVLVDELTLPTPAVTLQSRLSACDACEPFIDQTREVDIRTRNASADREEALAAQEHAEAERRQARLAATPPLLDDPRPPHPPPRLDVHVTTGQPGPPAPPPGR